MGREVQHRSLQDLIDATPDLVEYFYHETLAPHAKHRPELSPVPPEFTNWRDEQRAWRESAILFDQSHHMPELFLKGPGAFSLLERLGINNFHNFVPGRAKQYVACNARGYVIGECILHRHVLDEFELISGMYLLDWVHFNAERGGYDVTVSRDNATWDNPAGRRVKFRFQIDGPNASKIFAAVVEGQVPEIPFFHTARVRIAGHEVHVLRHGMAGHQGVELSGPYEEGPAVRAAILEAGRAWGLMRAGTRTYFSTVGEEGWIPYPLPAIYTGEDLREFRQWLSADSWEAKAQLGGSFRSKNIEDYYVTPYDLGLDRLMKFDHHFVGRAALERMAREPHRTKVTLVWNKDDVARVRDSLYQPGIPYKFMEMPVSYYSFQQNDEVRSLDGRLIGISTFCGYTINERETLSLAMVDVADASPGTEVVVRWGERDGGSRKPHVERHRQTDIRATVAPVPYALAVQRLKRAAVGPSQG